MKKIKIGVFGAGRGVDLAQNFMMLNCDIVALCDFIPERLKKGASRLGDVALEQLVVRLHGDGAADAAAAACYKSDFLHSQFLPQRVCFFPSIVP